MNVTKPHRPRRTRKPHSDEELIALALDRYGPLNKGLRPKKISEIAKAHQRDPAVVQRAIKNAFLRKLVAVDRRKYPIPSRNRELEEQLLAKFSGLHKAIVVEPVFGKALTPANREDKIHDELGKAVAHYVSTSAIIHDRARIGIGSGRGVFSFVRGLSFNERLRAKGVTALSLTGDVYARTHSFWKPNVWSTGIEGLNCQLDADDLLNLLAMSFGQPVNSVMMSSSIAWEKRELEKQLKQKILDPVEWKSKAPHVAFIGVGVLSGGHRLFEEAQAPANRQEARLKPILSELTRLVDLNKPIQVGNLPYVAVADICNRLFYVRPPRGVRFTPEREKRTKLLIDSINEKLLTPSKEQLQSIPTLVLIAGSLKKVFAIKQLLDSEEYNIRILCVDEEVAEAIISTDQI